MKKKLTFITGAVIIDEHFDLLQQAVDRGLAGNIEIHYNTNTTTVPRRGLELW